MFINIVSLPRSKVNTDFKRVCVFSVSFYIAPVAVHWTIVLETKI